MIAPKLMGAFIMELYGNGAQFLDKCNKKETGLSADSLYLKILSSNFERTRKIYYTRSTLPDLSALADTQTRFGLPFTRIRTF